MQWWHFNKDQLVNVYYMPLPNPSPYICAIWQWDVDKVL